MLKMIIPSVLRLSKNDKTILTDNSNGGILWVSGVWLMILLSVRASFGRLISEATTLIKEGCTNKSSGNVIFFHIEGGVSDDQKP